MKLSEVYQILNTAAPKRLSDTYCEKYGAYDNSGILVDTGEEIQKVLFSLDFSYATIEKAEKSGANLIVTHHPAIYAKLGNVRIDEPLGKKLSLCIKKGISVVSQHLNLDVVEGGIDHALASGILLASGSEDTEFSVCSPVTEKDGYGRAYAVKEITLEKLFENLKEVFQTNRALCYGDKDRKINRVASFCGAGGDYEGVAFAYAQNADVIVSADFKHHTIVDALERDVCVIALTHYASENYGFQKYYEKIRKALDISCEFHTDETVL